MWWPAGDSDIASDQKSFSPDGRRIKQTGECRGEDEERDDDEEQTIDEPRQDLHTIISTAHGHTLSIMCLHFNVLSIDFVHVTN